VAVGYDAPIGYDSATPYDGVEGGVPPAPSASVRRIILLPIGGQAVAVRIPPPPA
jgi:hypothetical protein